MEGDTDKRLSLSLRDLNSLYTAYMPFIKNGGLFFPTKKPYKLGDELFVLLTLNVGATKETLPIAGQVVWVTPSGSHGGRRQGVGIKFNDLDRGSTKTKIETYLAASLQASRPTHTM